MSDPFYRSDTWRRLRAEVLRRQPTCATPGCAARSVAVDHVVQRAKGGPDALGNLRGLCPPCHNQRRRGGEPRVKGCAPDGTPLDPSHWWRK
jgi:5-methylcytosine-specific restriction endonuclease McrA